MCTEPTLFAFCVTAKIGQVNDDLENSCGISSYGPFTSASVCGSFKNASFFTYIDVISKEYLKYILTLAIPYNVRLCEELCKPVALCVRAFGSLR